MKVFKKCIEISEYGLQSLIRDVNDYWSTEEPSCVLNEKMGFQEILENCEGFEIEDKYRFETFFLEELDESSRIKVANEIKKLLAKTSQK